MTCPICGSSEVEFWEMVNDTKTFLCFSCGSKFEVDSDE